MHHYQLPIATDSRLSEHTQYIIENCDSPKKVLKRRWRASRAHITQETTSYCKDYKFESRHKIFVMNGIEPPTPQLFGAPGPAFLTRSSSLLPPPIITRKDAVPIPPNMAKKPRKKYVPSAPLQLRLRSKAVEEAENVPITTEALVALAEETSTALSLLTLQRPVISTPSYRIIDSGSRMLQSHNAQEISGNVNRNINTALGKRKRPENTEESAPAPLKIRISARGIRTKKELQKHSKYSEKQTRY